MLRINFITTRNLMYERNVLSHATWYIHNKKRIKVGMVVICVTI